MEGSQNTCYYHFYGFCSKSSFLKIALILYLRLKKYVKNLKTYFSNVTLNSNFFAKTAVRKS